MGASSGTLAARLVADTANFRAEMTNAANVSEKELKRAANAARYVNDYIRETSRLTKDVGTAAPAIQTSAKHMEEFGFHTAGAKRELLVLAHELSQGNFSKFGGSLLVLGERTGAASLLFSALGIAALAAGGAVLGFVAAIVKGHNEQDAFNKSLQVTGNFAGQTASSFDALAASAAKAANVSSGAGRDALQALVSTGRIGQDAIVGATLATLNMERLTGQSAEEIAKDFGKMSDGVAKWAADHNKQYHYLTFAQFEYIKQLEDQGKKEQAEVENFRILNEKMGHTVTNLGYLSTAWKFVKEEASGAWEAMKGVGKDNTTAEQIARVQKLLQDRQARGPLNDRTRGSFDVGNERLRQELYMLTEKQKLERKSVDLQSQQAAAAEKSIDKVMGKQDKYDPLNAIRDPRALYKNDFLRSEIESYDELAKAEAKAREEAEKMQKERDKSFNSWFQKFNEDDIGKNMDPGAARSSAIGKYLREIGDQTKQAEQLVNGSFSRMEDAIVEFAKTGKLSFSSLWSFMAEEFLRNQIRMVEKEYLLDSAGSFKGFGSIVSSIGSWFSGATGHAQGLASVPYDGYPALLHEGERVMTRAENQSSGGASVHLDYSGQTINVGQGVSRAEVHAAVAQANAASEQRIRRLVSQGAI